MNDESKAMQEATYVARVKAGESLRVGPSDATNDVPHHHYGDERGDVLISSLLRALTEFDTDFLLEAAEQGALVAPDGWLPAMLREYLACYR